MAGDTLRVDRDGLGGWAVFDGAQKVSGTTSDRVRALEQLDTLRRKARVKKRPCITGCGHVILSEGPHHRMCSRCRQRSQPVAL